MANKAVAFESVTVAGTAIGPTATILVTTNGKPIVEMLGRLETGQVRFTLDGTTPTSSVGTLLEVGDMITVKGGANIAQFKAIRTTGTSGALKLTYFQLEQ